MFENLLQFLIKSAFTSSLFSSLRAWKFKTMILNQRPLRTTQDILSLTYSTLLTSDTILCRLENPVHNLFFHRKNKVSCSYPAPIVPPNLLYTQ